MRLKARGGPNIAAVALLTMVYHMTSDGTAIRISALNASTAATKLAPGRAWPEGA